MGRIANTNKYPFDTDVELTDYIVGTNNIGVKKSTRNYQISALFDAFLTFAGVTCMTLNDIISVTYDYYGGIYGKDDDWVIFRYLKTDLNQKGQAAIASNLQYSDLATAWTNKDTLNYDVI